MQLNEIKCKAFYMRCRIDNNTGQVNFRWGKQTKTRPNQEIGEVIYKFTKYHEIIPTEKEKVDFINKYNNDAKHNVSIGPIEFYNFLMNVEQSENNWTCDKLHSQEYLYVYLSYDYRSGKSEIVLPEHFLIIKKDDGEIIKGFKKSELTRKEKIAKQEADFKVMTSILKISLDNLCDKYGMKLTDNGIYFKDRLCYNKFIKEALSNTIIKELNENGYEAKINPRIQAIKYNTQIVNKKDLKFKT